MKTTYEVLIGKHKLSSDFTGVSEHWALGIKCDGETVWYEVAGASKEATYSPNRIETHDDSTKYTAGIESRGEHTFDGGMQQFQDWLREWHEEWVNSHPYYKLNGDNCQLHVKDFLKQLHVKIKTQNSAIGSVAVGFGVGAIVLGTLTLVTGLLVRGSHR